MRKGKICIVTAHFLRNYGSVLQAYALQRCLEKMGWDVTILNYIPDIATPLSRSEKIKSRIVRVIKNDPLFSIKRKERSRKFQKFRNKYLHLTEQFTKIESITSFVQTEAFYAVICGSDQIWNPNLYGGFNLVFFLEPIPVESRCISYAPSIRVKSLKNSESDTFRRLLDKFTAISVREKSSVQLLSKICDKPIEWVCDPTLLLSRTEWDSIKPKMRLPSSYGVVYEIYSDSELENFIKKSRNSYRFYNISNNIDRINGASNYFADIGPLEFISLISNASLVITNSFHCVVFCIIYNIQFVCFEQPNDDRVGSLLSFLGLSSRIVNNCDDAMSLMSSSDIDFSEISERINSFSDRSKDFLTRALR